MEKKRLSPERRGLIATALLNKLPQPTEKELRTVARKTGTSLSEVRKLLGDPPRKTGKLTRAS
jgi:hypothetical protein